MSEGLPIIDILNDFYKAKLQADVLVAHNLSFDHAVIWAAFLREGMEPLRGMNKICTMKETTKLCKLPQANGRGGYKWPKLEELYRFLFKHDFEGAHDALSDVRALRECFF